MKYYIVIAFDNSNVRHILQGRGFLNETITKIKKYKHFRSAKRYVDMNFPILKINFKTMYVYEVDDKDLEDLYANKELKNASSKIRYLCA